MRIGLIGTGAIAQLHARAYKNIGYTVRVCTSRTEETGRRFAAQHGAEYVATADEVCGHAEVDFVDVCTLPSIRLEPVRLCARHRKHVQVQKPIATTVDTAREMIALAAGAGSCSTSSASIGSTMRSGFLRARCAAIGSDGCCSATRT